MLCIKTLAAIWQLYNLDVLDHAMHIHENTHTCTRMLTHKHIHLRVCTHAHICTHRGTSVQGTPSILNADPGLVSVFTCKWSTTICGPFVGSVPPAVWAWGRELLVRWGDRIRWAPMVMEPNAPKGEGRGCLPGSH